MLRNPVLWKLEIVIGHAIWSVEAPFFLLLAVIYFFAPLFRRRRRFILPPPLLKYEDIMLRSFCLLLSLSIPLRTSFNVMPVFGSIGTARTPIFSDLTPKPSGIVEKYRSFHRNLRLLTQLTNVTLLIIMKYPVMFQHPSLIVFLEYFDTNSFLRRGGSDSDDRSRSCPEGLSNV